MQKNTRSSSVDERLNKLAEKWLTKPPPKPPPPPPPPSPPPKTLKEDKNVGSISLWNELDDGKISVGGEEDENVGTISEGDKPSLKTSLDYEQLNSKAAQRFNSKAAQLAHCKKMIKEAQNKTQRRRHEPWQEEWVEPVQVDWGHRLQVDWLTGNVYNHLPAIWYRAPEGACGWINNYAVCSFCSGRHGLCYREPCHDKKKKPCLCVTCRKNPECKEWH